VPDMAEHTVATERWLPVPGYTGLYEVSDMGRLRSVDRVVLRSGRPMRQRGRVLKPWKDHKGYQVIRMGRDGNKSTNTYIHQVVLTVFVGPRPDGLHACHRDGNKSDNRPGNLRWDTLLENNRDIIRHGNHNRVNTVNCPRGHPLVAPNLVASHPGRTCLACHKSRGYCRYHGKIMGRPVDFVAIADRYFAEIMSSEAA
jgi:hypothetical protein